MFDCFAAVSIQSCCCICTQNFSGDGPSGDRKANLVEKQRFLLAIHPALHCGWCRVPIQVVQCKRVVKCSVSGQRGMLRYQFPASVHPQGLRKKLYLHRLWAFNCLAINPGLHPFAFSNNNVVHHRPHPHWRPWSNSRTVNMVLMTRRQHQDWHLAHPGVAQAP